MTRELVLDSLWLAGEMVWRDSVTAGAVLYLPGWERNGLLASRRILSNNVFWRFPPLRSNLIPGTPAQRPPHIPATSPTHIFSPALKSPVYFSFFLLGHLENVNLVQGSSEPLSNSSCGCSVVIGFSVLCCCLLCGTEQL